MANETISRIAKLLIKLPTFPDKERTQNARWFIPSLIVLVIVATISNFLSPDGKELVVENTITWANRVAVVLLLVALIIVWLGHLKTAALIVLMTLFTAAAYLNIMIFQTIRSPDVMIYFVLIPLTGLLLGKRAMGWLSTLCIATIFLNYFLERAHMIMPFTGKPATTNDLVIILMATILNAIFLYAAIGRAEAKAKEAQQSADQLTLANRELALSQSALQEARAELEIRVVERTQELLQANMRLKTEIEERQRLLNALHKSEANWRSLVTNAPELIVTISTAGVVSFINRSVGGQPAEHIVGTHATRLYIAPKDQALFKQQMEHVLLTGKTVTYESESEVDQRVVWYLNRLGAIQQAGRIEALILIATDITEQKQTESAMHRMQKMESLGVLAGGVAHDFNNLLAAMSGQQSLALLKLPEDDPRRRYLLQTMKAIERATELTRQMLNYAGRGRSEQKLIQLNDLVTDNIHLFSASIPKNIRLATVLADNLPMVYGDQGQLQQVIMNLILNSADAISKEMGEVRLYTHFFHLSTQESLKWSWAGEVLKPGPYVLLEVQDTGCGMDAATLAKIFDPFFTTKFTGRGLGLASVLGIVRSHHGGLRVESTPGYGTTFFILLPVAIQNPASQDVARPKQPIAMHDELVLLIDDEQAICEATAEILTTTGLRVLQACDGYTGLNEFRQRRAEIQLVILDLSMPKISGEIVLQELRKLNDEIPVIVTSGYDELEVMKRMQGRAVSFLQKPYTLDVLLETVQQHLYDPSVKAERVLAKT